MLRFVLNLRSPDPTFSNDADNPERKRTQKSSRQEARLSVFCFVLFCFVPSELLLAPDPVKPQALNHRSNVAVQVEPPRCVKSLFGRGDFPLSLANADEITKIFVVEMLQT
jgi:hypothetical protein